MWELFDQEAGSAGLATTVSAQHVQTSKVYVRRGNVCMYAFMYVCLYRCFYASSKSIYLHTYVPTYLCACVAMYLSICPCA